MSEVLEYRIVGAVDETSLASSVQMLIDNPPVGSVWRPLGAPFIKESLMSASNFSPVFQVNLLTGINSFSQFFQAMVRYGR